MTSRTFRLSVGKRSAGTSFLARRRFVFFRSCLDARPEPRLIRGGRTGSYPVRTAQTPSGFCFLICGGVAHSFRGPQLSDCRSGKTSKRRVCVHECTYTCIGAGDSRRVGCSALRCWEVRQRWGRGGSSYKIGTRGLIQ